MECLSFKDPIKIGEYSGETVESCVKKYGKRSLMEVLKYYNLSAEVQREYHFHLKPKEDSCDKNEKEVLINEHSCLNTMNLKKNLGPVETECADDLKKISYLLWCRRNKHLVDSSNHVLTILNNE